MSAQNWDVCQKCRKEFERKKVALRKRAENLFVNGTREEYDAAMSQSRQADASKPPETLAEYYEIGINAAGVFELSYHAICHSCGFEFSFNVSERAVK